MKRRNDIFAPRPRLAYPDGISFVSLARLRMQTFGGMRAYYRRRLPSRFVKVYFCDAAGRKMGWVDMEPMAAAAIRRGKSYTIEMMQR